MARGASDFDAINAVQGAITARWAY